MQYNLEFGIVLALILAASVTYYVVVFAKTIAKVNKQKKLSIANLSSIREKRSRRHKIITMSAIREEDAAQSVVTTKAKAQQALID